MTVEEKTATQAIEERQEQNAGTNYYLFRVKYLTSVSSKKNPLLWISGSEVDSVIDSISDYRMMILDSNCFQLSSHMIPTSTTSMETGLSICLRVMT